MPHVVVTGPVSVAQAAEALAPATEKQGDTVLRIQETWVAKAREALMVEGVVVEQGKPRPLLVSITPRPDGVVARISPLAEGVERTEGVQRFVAWLGRKVHDAQEGRGYGPTNLERFLR